MKSLTLILTSAGLLSLSGIVSAECSKCDKRSKVACEKIECKSDKASGPSAYFIVKGMTCGGCSGKVKEALAKIKGVKVQKVCHKSGCAVVNFDASKTNKAAIATAIKGTGFKVAGEKIKLNVTGMTCGGCEKTVSKAINAVEGCTVEKVCRKSGCVEILVTSGTDHATVEAAIKKTGFKIAAKK